MHETHDQANAKTFIISYAAPADGHENASTTPMDLGQTGRETKQCTYCNRFSHLESERQTKKVRFRVADANPVIKNKVKCFQCGKLTILLVSVRQKVKIFK
jgi:hypothetical protein